eukprot:1825858-Amphidinium_carterae.1
MDKKKKENNNKKREDVQEHAGTEDAVRDKKLVTKQGPFYARRHGPCNGKSRMHDLQMCFWTVI